MPEKPIDLERRLQRSANRSNRTKNVQTRVTPEEDVALKKAAEKSGKVLSEWTRDVLLAGANEEPSLRAIFTELMALRSLMNHLLPSIAQGRNLTREQVTQFANDIAAKKHETAEEILKLYVNPLGEK